MSTDSSPILFFFKAKASKPPKAYTDQNDTRWAQRLSNFYPSEIVIDSKAYATVEHYFQAMKFENTCPEYAEWFVKGAKHYIGDDPAVAKSAGSKSGSKKVFKREPLLDPEWFKTEGKQKRIVVMQRALAAKFTQEPFKNLLLSTGERPLIHFERFGSFWGQKGLEGKGENMLGKLLMKLRRGLKK